MSRVCSFKVESFDSQSTVLFLCFLLNLCFWKLFIQKGLKLSLKAARFVEITRIYSLPLESFLEWKSWRMQKVNKWCVFREKPVEKKDEVKQRKWRGKKANIWSRNQRTDEIWIKNFVSPLYWICFRSNRSFRLLFP